MDHKTEAEIERLSARLLERQIAVEKQDAEIERLRESLDRWKVRAYKYESGLEAERRLLESVRRRERDANAEVGRLQQDRRDKERQLPEVRAGIVDAITQDVESAYSDEEWERLERERDEALAEVKRLREDNKQLRKCYSESRSLVASTALWWYAHREAGNESELYGDFLRACRAAHEAMMNGGDDE